MSKIEVCAANLASGLLAPILPDHICTRFTDIRVKVRFEGRFDLFRKGETLTPPIPHQIGATLIVHQRRDEKTIRPFFYL